MDSCTPVLRLLGIVSVAFAVACGSVILPTEPRDAGFAPEDAGSSEPIDAGPAEDSGTLATLEVRALGNGAGALTVAGALCNSPCTFEIPVPMSVTLTASSALGSRFVGWSSPCDSSGPTCVLQVEGDVTVEATFALTDVVLTVTLAGDGDGRVTSNPPRIDCPGRCVGSFVAGTEVVLSAVPQPPHVFDEWSGPCSARGASCTLRMVADVEVSAAFVPPGGFARFSSVMDLGAFDPAGERWGQDINDAGAAVGWARTLEGHQRAFRKLPANPQLTNLGTLGGMESLGWGINATGWTIGEAQTPAGERHAVLWAPAPSMMVTDLGTLGGLESVADGINSSNWIVGRSDLANGSRRAFLVRPGVSMADLGTLGGPSSAAEDINDDGWVVGQAELPNGDVHAFRARPEMNATLTDLGTLGGPNSQGKSINEGGAIVGYAEVAGGAPHAFYLGPPPATGLLDLGTLGGGISFAYGVNDDGIAVGAAQNAQGQFRAFIWSRDTRVMVDLNALLPRGATDWDLRFARAISNSGRIVGMGVHDGAPRAFLIEP